ncbi:MAG: hypothetical protein ACI4QM_00565, partial [Alphaproteobacteria bacterium]
MKNSTILVLFGITAAAMMPAYATQNDASLVICRGQQCADVKYTMTAPYLFNTLTDLFSKNIGKEVLLCEADVISHRCYQPALNMQAASNTTRVDLSIPSADIVDAKPDKNKLILNTIFDFNVKANDTQPQCESAAGQLIVTQADAVSLTLNGLKCAFTATGSSDMNMNFVVDYIDFDYGTIGAYYALGAAQVMRGGKTGYALLRFTEKMPHTVFELNALKETLVQADVDKVDSADEADAAVTKTPVSVSAAKTPTSPVVTKTMETVTKTTTVKVPKEPEPPQIRNITIKVEQAPCTPPVVAQTQSDTVADAAQPSVNKADAEITPPATPETISADAQPTAETLTPADKPFSCADCALRIKETTRITQVAAADAAIPAEADALFVVPPEQAVIPADTLIVPVQPVVPDEMADKEKQSSQSMPDERLIPSVTNVRAEEMPMPSVIQSVAVEQPTVSAVSQAAEDAPGFWTRFTDKIVKAFYLEESLFE